MNPQQSAQPEVEPTWSTPPETQPAPTTPEEVQQSAAPETEQDDQEIIAWEASESIHHEKDMMWFVGIIAAGVLLAVVSIFLIKSITFTVLIVVMVVALIVLARRPPRVLHYELHPEGLVIEDKEYRFQEFKAFGVVREGPFYYAVLIPVKRFAPSIDVYFPEEYGEDIVDVLGAHIAMQTIKPDWLDKVTKQLRF
jgi:hypothetical protein